MSLMPKLWLRRSLAGAALAAAAVSPALAVEVNGAGASFPYPVYAKWADAYNQKTGNTINYQSIGSGGGIKQIKARTVDFGATDAPLQEKELKEAGLIQFPTVMGGVVPAINLEGVKPGQLTLTGEVLADIYMGEIKSWNAPEIQKLNPKVKLPDQPIAVVHRSDGSGTSFLFTTYLSNVSQDWQKKVGANTAVQWPVGVGAKGNEGVANMVDRTDGAIGYVEYAYVKQNDLNYAALQNQAGATVQPDAKSFQSAAANADWKGTPGYGVILTNQPGKESWPITGATFILVHEKPQNPDAVAAALDFFRWAYANGDQMALELDYVPMPDSVVKQVEETWSQIKGPQGKPLADTSAQ